MIITDNRAIIHYGDVPNQCGWYYCLIKDLNYCQRGRMVYFDARSGKWNVKDDERVICWGETLE